MDLADTYRIFHTIAVEYTLSSTAHGTFSKIDHVLGCETSLNNTKKLK
jgi:hypothetical protein